MMEYLSMVDKLLNEYDAFFISNKYCDKNLEGNTHQNEFIKLFDLFKEDLVSTKAINWILHCYDCYYKKDYINDSESAFAHLKNEIKRKFQ